MDPVDPDPDPDPQHCLLLLFLLTVGTFKTVFKVNKSLKSHKTVFSFFLLLKERSGSIHMITDLDPYTGGPKTYGASGSGTLVLVLQKRK